MPRITIPMGWFAQPENIVLSAPAKVVFLTAIDFCLSGRTDGKVTKQRMSAAIRLSSATEDVIAELTASGHLTPDGDGWTIPAYATFAPTTDRLDAQRERANERLKRHRNKPQKTSGGPLTGSVDVYGSTRLPSPAVVREYEAIIAKNTHWREHIERRVEAKAVDFPEASREAEKAQYRLNIARRWIGHPSEAPAKPVRSIYRDIPAVAPK